tara:strand:+ start:271 stop:864 length:594 start_codon:yes stop_codon:yes gene_type:complete
MNIFELIIDEEAEVFGIEAISLVEQPAIQSDWIAMKSHDVKFKTQDESKRIVMGAALIPDKPIYRSQDGKEFYVYFSKKTVRRAMELYFKHHNQGNATLEHEHPVLDSYVVESWIVESEQDKSRAHGLDVPAGTWMVSMKIENDKLWNEYISTGKVKAFSIEGFFSNRFEAEKMSDHDLILKEVEDLCQELVEKTVK